MADRWRRVKAKEVDEAVAERCRSFGITLPEVEFRVLDIAATKPFALAGLPLRISNRRAYRHQALCPCGPAASHSSARV